MSKLGEGIAIAAVWLSIAAILIFGHLPSNDAYTLIGGGVGATALIAIFL